jgi:hypothetical protein
MNSMGIAMHTWMSALVTLMLLVTGELADRQNKVREPIQRFAAPEAANQMHLCQFSDPFYAASGSG